jgi:hypothetical protein
MAADDFDYDYSAEELERARRRRVIDEARATVSRLKREERARHEVERLPGPDLARRLIPAPEDRISKWRREADERDAARERMKAEIMTPNHEPFDWSAFDARIEAVIARERRIMAEALGEEVSKLLVEEREDRMRTLREKINELRLEVAKLGSESAALREQLAGRGKVVDLPSLRQVN